MLRVRRSNRRCDGLRRLRRAGPAGRTGTTVEARSRPAVHTRLDHGVLLPVVSVVPAAVMAGDAEAGEENGRDDEQDPGHDHNPRREPV